MNGALSLLPLDVHGMDTDNFALTMRATCSIHFIPNGMIILLPNDV